MQPQPSKSPDRPPSFQEEADRLRRLVAKKIPEILVGDVWTDVYGMSGEMTVVSSEPIENLPWPFVLLQAGKQSINIGAPAFIYGKLVKRGKGKRAWPATTP